MKKWETTMQYDEESDAHFIVLPDDLLDEVDLNMGDEVEWIDNKDGSWSLKKVDYVVEKQVQSYSDEIIQWPLETIELDPVVYSSMMKGLTKLTPVKAGWTAEFLLNNK